MPESNPSARFEAVDWDAVDRSRRLLTAERVVLLVGLTALAAAWLYDTYVAHVYIVFEWQVHRVDWVVLLGGVLLAAYVGVPMVRNRDETLAVLRALFSRRVTAAGTIVVGLLVVVGVLGPALISTPSLRFQYAWHPPFGTSTELAGGDCVGEITTDNRITQYCHGTLEGYPFGANHRGHPMEWLVANGARTALYVAVFTMAFVVPVATVVGVIAGLRGGLLDDLLMAYVDVQLSVPAIIVYFIGYMYWNPSLLLLLVTFGLLSWGGIARLVRSEVLQRREAGFVMVARSLGAPQTYLARRHILPNVTNTLVPSVFQLVALLILVEAGIAFLGFQEAYVHSWGATIAEGVDPTQTVGNVRGLDLHPHQYWWVATLPAFGLGVTIAAFKIVGDGLRDALDPRSVH